jgi:hypothetical protein
MARNQQSQIACGTNQRIQRFAVNILGIYIITSFSIFLTSYQYYFLLNFFLQGEKELERGLAYVAFSRILVIEQLFVGQGCSLDRFITKVLQGLKIKLQLEEDDRLNMMYNKQKDYMICNDTDYI